MSDFLVNLARRASGLAPVVRARPALIPEAVPTYQADEPDAGPTPTEDRRPGPTEGADHERTVANASTTPAPAPSAPVSPQPPASTPGGVIRRRATAMPADSVSAAARGGPGAPLIPALAATAARPVDPRPAIVSQQTAAATLRDVAEPTGPSIGPKTVVGEAGALPASSTSGEGDDPLPRAATSGGTETSEPGVERPTPAETPGPSVVIIDSRATIEGPEVVPVVLPTPEPVLVSPPAPSRPATGPTDSVPERVVHVRIGAIEIHAAPSAGEPPSSPIPAPAPAAVPADGFDDFAGLRNYASWGW